MKVICLLVLLAVAANCSTIRKVREASGAVAIEDSKSINPEEGADDLETAETFYKKVYVPVPVPVYIKPVHPLHHLLGGLGGGLGGGFGGGFGGGPQNLLHAKLSLLGSLVD